MTNNKDLSVQFDILIRHVHGFYTEGMSLIELAHRLRTEANALVPILKMFITKDIDDTKYNR